MHHVSLELHCGRCVGLLGPNGAGKTSLLKAVAGLIRRETGTIEIGGHDGSAGHGAYVAYLPQRSAVIELVEPIRRGRSNGGRRSLERDETERTGGSAD